MSATSPGATRSRVAGPAAGRPARSGVVPRTSASRAGSSSTARRGAASAASVASSAPVYAVLAGTTARPYRSAATYATTSSTLGAPETSTRSPGASPAAAYRPAATSVRSASSAAVTHTPSTVDKVARAGSRVHAAVHAPGSVSPSARSGATPAGTWMFTEPPDSLRGSRCHVAGDRLRPEVDDRGHGTPAVRALVRRQHRDEHRRVAGHRRGHATDARLDLPVPVHVGVVEHGVAPPAHQPVAGRLALEEHVDQPALQVAVVRPIGQLQPGVADRGPDAVGVQRIAHDAVPDAVPAADAARVAHHDDLRPVQLHPRGAGRDGGVQGPVVQHVGVRRRVDLAEGDRDPERGTPVGHVHGSEGVLGEHVVAAALGVADGVDGQQRRLGLHVVDVGGVGDARLGHRAGHPGRDLLDHAAPADLLGPDRVAHRHPDGQPRLVVSQHLGWISKAALVGGLRPLRGCRREDRRMWTEHAVGAAGPDDRDVRHLVGVARSLGAQRVPEGAVGDDAGVVVHPAVALGLADDRDDPVGLDDPVVDERGETGGVADVLERYLTHLDGFGHAHLSLTTVPARPATPSAIRSSDVMTAHSPPASTNRQAASTFGPMSPLANSPAAACRRSSSTRTTPSGRACAVPQPSCAASTSVARTRRRAPTVRASSAAARSLSMTASTPRKVPSGSRTTGIPPPPAAITRYPAASSVPTAGASSTSTGSGDATTRRQPRAPRSRHTCPCSIITFASSAGRYRPMGLVGAWKPGSAASTRVRVTSAATGRRPASVRSSALHRTKPMVPWVCAPHQSSGTGGTTVAASSFFTRMLPTCGPLPCVARTSTPVATTSAMRRAARPRAAIWSCGPARPSGAVIALPPRAMRTRPAAPGPPPAGRSWTLAPPGGGTGGQDLGLLIAGPPPRDPDRRTAAGTPGRGRRTARHRVARRAATRAAPPWRRDPPRPHRSRRGRRPRTPCPTARPAPPRRRAAPAGRPSRRPRWYGSGSPRPRAPVRRRPARRPCARSGRPGRR